METLSTREAAQRVGVNVQKFHRLVAKHALKPAIEIPGQGGAKFWHLADVEALAAELSVEAAS